MEQKPYTSPRIENLEFPWRLQLPISRCILRGCGDQTPCTLTLRSSNTEPYRLRSQTIALGCCAPKTLQWLRHLIEFERLKHCNQVVVLEAQLPSVRVWRRSPQSAEGLGGAAPQGAISLGARLSRMQTALTGCSPSEKSECSTLELYAKDQDGNNYMMQFGTKGLHNSQNIKLGFPLEARLPAP